MLFAIFIPFFTFLLFPLFSPFLKLHDQNYKAEFMKVKKIYPVKIKDVLKGEDE